MKKLAISVLGIVSIILFLSWESICKKYEQVCEEHRKKELEKTKTTEEILEWKQTLTLSKDNLIALTYSLDGKELITADMGGNIKFCSLETGEENRSLS